MENDEVDIVYSVGYLCRTALASFSAFNPRRAASAAAAALIDRGQGARARRLATPKKCRFARETKFEKTEAHEKQKYQVKSCRLKWRQDSHEEAFIKYSHEEAFIK